MKSLTLRRAALPALIALALGALSACGGQSNSATANDPAAPSAQSSSSGDQQTAAKSGSTVSGRDFLALMKEASAKITTAKVSMTGDTSGQTYTMKGALDLTGDKPAMDLNLNMGSSGLSGVEMRLVDGTMYMSLGSMTQGKFVKFDLDDPHSPLGSLSGSLDNLDPAKLMGDLRPDAFRHIRYVGTDASGKHYRATLVTAKSPQIKGLPPSATANLPKTMGYDVWLDKAGRLSKFVADVPRALKLTARYTDYGADMHITAPPAAQITDLPGTSPSV